MAYNVSICAGFYSHFIKILMSPSIICVGFILSWHAPGLMNLQCIFQLVVHFVNGKDYVYFCSWEGIRDSEGDPFKAERKQREFWMNILWNLKVLEHCVWFKNTMILQQTFEDTRESILDFQNIKPVKTVMGMGASIC